MWLEDWGKDAVKFHIEQATPPSFSLRSCCFGFSNMLGVAAGVPGELTYL